ncbi:MAG: hypothetical protein FIA94_00380 [Nitrospirae bacterium]|nr:hypothetical protein [Nitrospirota bacterium]
MKIFFSGIGGSGVSAIAGFTAAKGHEVFGSDRLFDAHPEHPVKRRLQANGVVIVPQDGRGIDRSFDLAVFSTAVERSNPDVIAAETSCVPTRTRPEYLAEIVSAYRTIAVAGTSGKSTTSGLLAYLMQRLGLSPNFIGGGRVKQFRTDKNPGNYVADSSEHLVIEACESDGTIVEYEPQHTLILNLDLDHHSIEETGRMFDVLSAKTSGSVHINADDLNLKLCSISGPRTFSIANDSACRAGEIRFYPFSTSFVVQDQQFQLSLPGRHNLYNALACISVLSGLGISLREIAEVLPDFTGIERRFDIHLNDGRRLVIDDYAHNPHKIRSLMETMRAVRDSICYIFQPHGFGPTRLMKDGYVSAFGQGLRASDRLVLLPIYYAGGTAAKDISSDDIAGPLRASGKSAVAVHDRKEIFGFLQEFDAYIVFGARDDSLSDLAEEIAKSLK